MAERDALQEARRTCLLIHGHKLACPIASRRLRKWLPPYDSRSDR